MSWFYKGFTVRNKYREILSANDENHSSEEGNALEFSTHFTIFETTEEANEFINATREFRDDNDYDDLGPYMVEEVVVGWG